MALRLLPGERIEAYARPTPWSYLPGYLRALSIAAWGGLLAVLFRLPAWARHDAGPPLRFWTYLWGNASVAYILAVLGLVAGGILFAFALRRTWWQGGVLGGAIGAVAVGVTAIWFPADYASALPGVLAVASLAGIALMDADRRARTIAFTNIRLVSEGGLLHRGEVQARYEDIADIDTDQGLLGRVLDFGDLVPVLSPHAKDEEGVTIRGIRPLAEGRELLAAMVQHATASAELKKAGDTESRLYRALQHFRQPADAATRGD